MLPYMSQALHTDPGHSSNYMYHNLIMLCQWNLLHVRVTIAGNITHVCMLLEPFAKRNTSPQRFITLLTINFDCF